MFDWIAHLIDRAGYVGIALLMFLEGLFPPIPSWLVMPLAGFEASQGRFSPFAVVVAGTAGSTLGAICWYFVGRLVGVERLKAFAARHGHWLTLTPAQVDRADRWFDRHGAPAVMMARVVPVVRLLISVPAGVFAMDLRRFILFTAIGDTMWNGLMTGAGYLLKSHYIQVKGYLNPISTLVLATVAVTYFIRIVTWKRRS
ncbi:DedA family protein [Sphingomonas sp. G124]|uniref:DedA family protein n=1 Tax=Sphingomonas cremea TaxID=2904799 RepID=A0A9X1TX45_9SPHN|nr:DedA family protein [Sphingomonas cremea]MCF2513472.1 DedA family protein [Sphingomonas cremea]